MVCRGTLIHTASSDNARRTLRSFARPARPGLLLLDLLHLRLVVPLGRLDGQAVVSVDGGFSCDVFASEHVRLEVRPQLPELERDPLVQGHVEHLVQLLQRELLGLGHQKVHQEPPDHIPARVEPERALRVHGPQHTRPRERQDEVEPPQHHREQRRADGPHVQWENLAGHHERHHAAPERVDRRENVDAHRHHPDTCLLARDPERKPGHKEKHRHPGERVEEQKPAAEPVDHEKCRDGKEEINEAESERRGQRRDLREPGVQENRRRVVGDHVDRAELLHERADERHDERVAVTAHGEHLSEPLEVRHLQRVLLHQQHVLVEQVATRQDPVVADLHGAFVRLLVAALAHQPPGGLRTKGDLEQHQHRGDHGGPEH